MVLDATFLNTQYYKVRIKDKEEQSRERSSYRKGAFGLSSITVANFTYFRIKRHILCVKLFCMSMSQYEKENVMTPKRRCMWNAADDTNINVDNSRLI